MPTDETLKKEETCHLEERPPPPVGGVKGIKNPKEGNPLNQLGTKGKPKGPVVGTAKHPPGKKAAGDGDVKRPAGPPRGTAKSPPPSPSVIPARTPVPIDTPEKANDESTKGELPAPPTTSTE
eukprot:TRINITY_DN21375_c0_g1_i2.p1 TRINITY_DN21375_c0_g1~~TRINITY_DN21375_c0_g1_i2.p1  ORF type:complete len:123 (+),score=35.63 TRINITY_DN21375_c0_g1_i2:49-417(+)